MIVEFGAAKEEAGHKKIYIDVTFLFFRVITFTSLKAKKTKNKKQKNYSYLNVTTTPTLQCMIISQGTIPDTLVKTTHITPATTL